MKRLGLLRHAKSDWDDMALRDFDRGLNGRGRRGAALIGRHIAQHATEHGIAWDLAVASPAERVRLTLEASRLDLPVQWDKRVYESDAETLLEVLRECDDAAHSVLLVGHNPGLQELVFGLIAPEAENALFDEVAEKFPTATFAVIECDVAAWRDLASGCGRLVHLTRPRDLDPELGPERVG